MRKRVYFFLDSNQCEAFPDIIKFPDGVLLDDALQKLLLSIVLRVKGLGEYNYVESAPEILAQDHLVEYEVHKTAQVGVSVLRDEELPLTAFLVDEVRPF